MQDVHEIDTPKRALPSYCPISEPSRRTDRRLSSRCATVVIEEPAPLLATANPIDTTDRWCAVDELIAQPLVIPFTPVMLNELRDRPAEMTVAARVTDAEADCVPRTRPAHKTAPTVALTIGGGFRRHRAD
jgi:hypothetical protein